MHLTAAARPQVIYGNARRPVTAAASVVRPGRPLPLPVMQLTASPQLIVENGLP